MRWTKAANGGLKATSAATGSKYRILLTDGDPPYSLWRQARTELAYKSVARGDTVQAMKDCAEIMDAAK